MCLAVGSIQRKRCKIRIGDQRSACQWVAIIEGNRDIYIYVITADIANGNGHINLVNCVANFNGINGYGKVGNRNKQWIPVFIKERNL